MALQVMMCHSCVLMASSCSPCFVSTGLPTHQPDDIIIIVIIVTYRANIILGHGARNIAFVLEDEQTCSRETLPWSADTCSIIHVTLHTSSCNSPASSCRQSSIRSRSVASTTQMSVSVFSK